MIRRENFNLNYFPILKCWPHDGGRFITLPCVVTRDPRSGKRNIGMYRMQVYDGQTTGMHWQRQKVAAEHYREALRASLAAAIHRGSAHRKRRGHGRVGRRRGRHPRRPHRRPASGRARQSQRLAPRSCRSHRHRSSHHLCRHRPRSARGRGVSHRRIPARQAGRNRPVRNRRSPGSRPRRNRARRLRRTGRTAQRRPLRRPHRLLHPHRRLPGLPPHLHHPSPRPHLRRHHRRQAAHGGRMDGQGRRAHLPARHADADSRTRRHSSPRRGRLPQPDAGLHPQKLPRPRAQGDERHLVARPGHVHQNASSWSTRTATCKTSPKSSCA